MKGALAAPVLLWHIMAELLITDINNYSLKEKYINSLPEYRIEKIRRLKHEKDKLLSLCAGLLVKRFVGDDIKVGKYGKPYSESGKRFNISHSGDYVIIALSDFEIGCDIEYEKELDYERTGKIVFHKNELRKLSEADDKKDYFYRVWTRKESFIKCIGKGFAFKASSVDLSELKDEFICGGRTFFFKEYMLKDAKIMLCTEDKILPDEIQIVKPEDL